MWQFFILKMMEKILIKVSIGTLFLYNFFFIDTKAIPYSERHAFCTERSRIGYGNYYEAQKKYNNCMSNAEYLIKKYEREQAEYRRRIKERENEDQRKEQMKNNKFDSIFGSPW